MSVQVDLASKEDSDTALATLAVKCLHLEIDTYPKPGLVSHIDTGAHRDMDAALLRTSADALTPYFIDLAAAGAAAAQFPRLRTIGIQAERAMLIRTDGINTHRGAIFTLGLLVSAAGFRTTDPTPRPLGEIVSRLWGGAILSAPLPWHTHGAHAARLYGAKGARHQAATGFPAVYSVGLPALKRGSALAPHDPEAARVECCFALIAEIDDTNLLHRGGVDGLAFAQSRAKEFLARGGVGRDDWREAAESLHSAFVSRNLSPGGSADLLAASLFVLELGDIC